MTSTYLPTPAPGPLTPTERDTLPGVSPLDSPNAIERLDRLRRIARTRGEAGLLDELATLSAPRARSALAAFLLAEANPKESK